MSWCINSLRIGKFPSLGPNQEELHGERRRGLRGKDLPIHGELSSMGLDMKELADSMGYKSFTNKTNPCPRCTCTVANQHQYADPPWEMRLQEDWRVAMLDTLVVVRVDSAEMAAAIWAALQQNKPERPTAGLVNFMSGSLSLKRPPIPKRTIPKVLPRFLDRERHQHTGVTPTPSSNVCCSCWYWCQFRKCSKTRPLAWLGLACPWLGLGWALPHNAMLTLVCTCSSDFSLCACVCVCVCVDIVMCFAMCRLEKLPPWK